MVLQSDVPEDYDELPAEWYEGLDVESLLTRSEYEPAVNKYGS